MTSILGEVFEPETPSSPSQAASGSASPLVNRATRLFEFLARAQRIKETPVRQAASYNEREGRVFWLGDLPSHEAVRSAHRGEKPDEAALLSVERVPRTPPPPPPEALLPWLDGEQFEDPGVEPVFDDQGGLDEGRGSVALQIPAPEDLAARERAKSDFDEWLQLWRSWAEDALDAEPVRDLYQALFSWGDRAASNPEDLEVVMAVGLLQWAPPNHDVVSRHLLTVPAEVRFARGSGLMSVGLAGGGGPALELDMLDAGATPKAGHLQDARVELAEIPVEALLSEPEIALPLRSLAHILDPACSYEGGDSRGQSSNPVVRFAPALIFRKRSGRSMLRALESVRDQLLEADAVPDGLVRLVEVVEQPDGGESPGRRDSEPHEVLLPLPANDAQLRIVERVDTQRQTVVQGPPGTGKTHTIANLICHLLAKGDRVLVTAQTDRALLELKDKLPSDIAELCVSVAGRNRSDQAEMKATIDGLNRRASEYRNEDSEKRLLERASRLDQIRRRKSEITSLLLAAREQETQTQAIAGREGTPSQIAERHAADAERFSWLLDFDPSDREDPPLDRDETAELLDLLAKENVRSVPSGTKPWSYDLDALPHPDEVAGIVSELNEAKRVLDAASDVTVGLSDHVNNSPAEVLRSLADDWNATHDEVDRILTSVGDWTEVALRDVFAGRVGAWKDRHRQIDDLLDGAASQLEQIPSALEISAPDDGLGALREQAAALLEHLDAGGRIGGIMKPRTVRNAAPLLEKVKVGGVPPLDAESLRRFLSWTEAAAALDRAERLWPSDVAIPHEDTLDERLSWNRDELSLLGRVVDVAEKMAGIRRRLTEVGLSGLRVEEPNDCRRLVGLADRVRATERHAESLDALGELQSRANELRGDDDPPSELAAALDALRDANPNGYAEHLRGLKQRETVVRAGARRDELLQRLATATTGLVTALRRAESGALVLAQTALLDDAWSWYRVAMWIQSMAATDVLGLERELQSLRDQEQNVLAELAANRAEASAITRLGEKERVALETYAQAVRRLGKGTGKHAPRHRREAEQALVRCGTAVPAWIMPLYRVAEQLQMAPDLFDVVIIDEASQAGPEACLLQYLARRLIVVGDDKQVSPAGVGISVDELQKHRDQLLSDLPSSEGLADREHSFFDMAVLRYGTAVTLQEHFRCVPEIIEFSNRVAYRPERVPLIPVRQLGAGRLEPIRTAYVADGYQTGTSGRMINEPEAEALVRQVLMCCSSREYESKTMGVISLTGSAQARLIEKLLLDELGPSEFKNRDLRCGDATDFQGSERDVMFLSMVVAPVEGKRTTALTRKIYLQRFNVSASRARDQMWVFHSVSRSELTNKEDLRFQLLDHCEMHQAAASAQRPGVPDEVPEDHLVDPFDSLFEQKVFNKIVRRGYRCASQYEVYGFRIDLVVEGLGSQFAVECDGDAWHGPEQFESDLGRQRELERCGWTFFRVRGSLFHADPDKALEPLWGLLGEHGITPVEDEPPLEEPVPPALGEASFRKYESPLRLNAAARREARADGPPPEEKTDSQNGHARPVQDAQPETSRTVPGAPSSEGQTPPDPPDQLDLHASSELSRPSAGSPAQAPAEVEPMSVSNYDAWDPEASSFRAVRPSSSEERIAALSSIVAVEGPILGRRLFDLYARSAGVPQLTKGIEGLMIAAVREAVDGGELVRSDPLGEWAVANMTFRLPDQPAVILRERGPRQFTEVPPEEVAAAATYERGGLLNHSAEERVAAIYDVELSDESIAARVGACIEAVEL